MKDKHVPDGCRKVQLINAGLFGAYRKGYQCGADPDAQCPYPDTRTYRGGVTFSRAFRRKWKLGRKHRRQGLPMQFARKPQGLNKAMGVATRGSWLAPQRYVGEGWVDQRGVLLVDNPDSPGLVQAAELIKKHG